MSDSRLTFYQCDDWVWVYDEFRLIFSGHSCSGQQLAEALGIEFESKWNRTDVPEEQLWIDTGPKQHDDFPKELFE